jgi:hypothetical protein
MAYKAKPPKLYPDRWDLRRFFIEIEVTPTGCWESGARPDKDGYTRFGWNGQSNGAHRQAYIWWGGALEPGDVIDHLCRNRRCCNPVHLEAVPQWENLWRGVKHRRHQGSVALMSQPASVCGD